MTSSQGWKDVKSIKLEDKVIYRKENSVITTQTKVHQPQLRDFITVKRIRSKMEVK